MQNFWHRPNMYFFYLEGKPTFGFYASSFRVSWAKVVLEIVFFSLVAEKIRNDYCLL